MRTLLPLLDHMGVPFLAFGHAPCAVGCTNSVPGVPAALPPCLLCVCVPGRSYPIVALSCLSLLTSDTEHPSAVARVVAGCVQLHFSQRCSKSSVLPPWWSLQGAPLMASRAAVPALNAPHPHPVAPQALPPWEDCVQGPITKFTVQRALARSQALKL